MNFALARRNYKGPLNFMAYIGLLGDLATVSGLYFLYKLKTMNSEEKKKIAEIQSRKENAKLFPARIEEIDYNKFSPYTPIPYHVSNITKYQHEHIDLIGFVNEKQLNVEKSYYRDFFDSYDTSQRKFNDWHDPYGLTKHHHGHGHGHNHGHSNSNENHNHNNSHDHTQDKKNNSHH